MASKPTAARRPASSRKIIPSARSATRTCACSLRQGLDDFRDLRGDIFFAGLIYTFIGIAAVVMTTNGPLDAVLLAGRRRRGLARPGRRGRLLRARAPPREGRGCPLVQLPRRPQAPVGRRHGDRRRPAAGHLRLVADRRRHSLCWPCSAGAAPTSVPSNSSATVLTTVARMGADRRRGAVVGAIFGWIVLALSVVSLPMLVDCDVNAPRRCPPHGARRTPTRRR